MVLTAGVVCFAAPARAELKVEQQEQLDAVNASFQEVVAAYRANKLDDVETLIGELQEKIDAISAASGNELVPLVASLKNRLTAAQRLLDTKREQMAAAKTVATAPTPKPGMPATPRGNNDDMGVSFVNDVAPLLTSRCANCHINGNRGGLNFGTYADLMRGSADGPILRPGAGTGSRLIDMLETGAMPPNGPLSDQEVAMVRTWIDQGARLDAGTPTTPLATLLVSTTPEPEPGVTAGPSVSLTRELAEVLVDNCVQCHSGQRPAENLDLASFSGIMGGGRSGAVIVPGRPAASLLIKKLKGTAPLGEQMPADSGPLDDATIAKFEAWIAQGARFDGGNNPGLAFSTIVAVRRAQAMTHDQLAASRARRAESTWQTGNPQVSFEKLETENFVVLGNVGPARLDEVAALAERQRQKISQALRLPANQPFLKGRLTIFAFDQRIDYTEFSRMVESRDVARGRQGHWFFNYVDAYAAILIDGSNETEMSLRTAPLLSEAMAGAQLDSLGEMPRWFAIGAARNIAARTEPGSPVIKEWQAGIAPALASPGQVDKFLETNNPDNDGLSLSYGFVGALMKQSAQYEAVLSAVKQGRDFDQAFRAAYKADPKAAFAAWARSGGR